MVKQQANPDHAHSADQPKPTTGVLLVNLGTPDSTKVSDVRKYLREFLMDGRVLDVNPVLRFILVNLIIAPFRGPKSAAEYRKLWTPKGSPLLFYGQELQELVQAQLGSDFVVELGMRYQNPSIKSALDKLKALDLERIVVMPLFPQYASATTGSVHEAVMKEVSKWFLIPEMHLIDAYPDHPKLIEVFREKGKRHLEEKSYDKILFSYHGLPERQLKKADPVCLTENCCHPYGGRNRLCYAAQCKETSRLLAESLGLKEDQWITTFQSRLGKTPWLQPYTEDTIQQLAKDGVKNLLVFSPAFVADCLETTIEIGEAYAEMFEEDSGGGHLQLVESLNTTPLWVEAVVEMVLEKAGMSKAAISE